jgi:hypothetical protein
MEIFHPTPFSPTQGRALKIYMPCINVFENQLKFQVLTSLLSILQMLVETNVGWVFDFLLF